MEFNKIVFNAIVKEIEQRAEQKMLLTGRLEGAHYAAMKELQKEVNDADSSN